jgi:hypothetical protein
MIVAAEAVAQAMSSASVLKGFPQKTQLAEQREKSRDRKALHRYT